MFGDNPEQESCLGFTPGVRKIRGTARVAETFRDWVKRPEMVAVGGFEPLTKGL
jgi:hypothetical protein